MTRTETQSRKRPAPGTSPPPQQQHQSFASPGLASAAQMSNEDFLAWGAGNGIPPQTQSGSGIYDLGEYDDMESQLNPEDISGKASNQLVRRNTEQQLAAGNRDSQVWPTGGAQTQGWNNSDDFEELEQRALAAKRDAQSKKPPKQVQPFIQKLWSLLSDNTNTDLISWTSNGDSFIVLDEERFANEQLPTYFKHNNYPSFVRQLNMYGFHKRVGLTDNSMRASETKAKSPSEYENPYFKRDKPILQWLITKPKQHSSKAKSKKTKDDEDESDENEGQEASAVRRTDGGARKLDLVTLPRTQLAQFQDEISRLKKSQQHINSMISRFQHENNQYIRHASAQHERHEQSINAILQFLATFYSQQRPEGSNITNLFHGAIHTPPQGNVQEVGEFDDSLSPSDNNQIARVRRQPLLLPAPQVGSERPASSRPASENASRSQRGSSRQGASQTPQPPAKPQSSAKSPEVKSDSGSPPNLSAIANESRKEGSMSNSQNANTPGNDMLAVINSMNANTPGAGDIDVNLALRNYENMNNGPLSPEQRDNMLSMLANTSGISPQVSNALLSSTGNYNGPQSALSQWAANKEQIDMLQRLQQEQDSKVQELAGRLQPLSPSGSIPGFDQAYNAAGGDVNFDNWLNSDLLNSDGVNADGADWNLDGNFSLNNADDYFGSAGNTAGLDDFGAAAQDGAAGSSGNALGGLFDNGAQADGDAPAPEGDGDGDGGARGRVIGSVTNSEGAHTPNADEDTPQGGRRKRRKA